MSTTVVANTLPITRSLRGAAQAAAARGEPLVVMTSLSGCVYCDVVRQHHLGPMVRAGQIHAVQIDIQDRKGLIQDFSGQQVSPADLSRRWNARFAPTVLFFDGQGREIAERLVGVAVPDFYGEYLQSRLEQARARLR
ncbi:MAG: thioredoxin fold domain-containing protein [Gammaproteobacteria bacterium]